MITSEERDLIRNELKRITDSLDLTRKQQGELHAVLTGAYEDLQEYKRQNPGASRQDCLKRLEASRTLLRERVAKFLTAEQLTQWDAEIAQGREFLRQKFAA